MEELDPEVWIVDGFNLGLEVGVLALLEGGQALQLGQEGGGRDGVLLNLQPGYPRIKVKLGIEESV